MSEKEVTCPKCGYGKTSDDFPIGTHLDEDGEDTGIFSMLICPNCGHIF